MLVGRITAEMNRNVMLGRSPIDREAKACEAMDRYRSDVGMGDGVTEGEAQSSNIETPAKRRR